MGIIFSNALVIYTQWKTYHTRTGSHEGGHAMRGAFTLRGASIRGAPIESLFFTGLLQGTAMSVEFHCLLPPHQDMRCAFHMGSDKVVCP